MIWIVIFVFQNEILIICIAITMVRNQIFMIWNLIQTGPEWAAGLLLVGKATASGAGCPPSILNGSFYLVAAKQISRQNFYSDFFYHVYDKNWKRKTNISEF